MYFGQTKIKKKIWLAVWLLLTPVVVMGSFAVAQTQLFVPSGAISIAPACTATGDVSVLVQGTYATEVRLSNSIDFSTSGFVSFVDKNVIPWQVNVGDGTRTVYAQFRGENGLLSPVVSATVLADKQTQCGTVELTQVVSDIFQVQTVGSDRVITGPAGSTVCEFPFQLTSTNGLIRNQNIATRQATSQGELFTFNHPTETSREEVTVRRQVSGCRATFSIVDLRQPATQFSVVVTPSADGVNYSPLNIWEHISLGPLTPSDEVIPEIPVLPACSEETVFGRMQAIGVLSEELRLQTNRRDDLVKQKVNGGEAARSAASALVESRNVLSQLGQSRVIWQKYLEQLSVRIVATEDELQKAQDEYRNLQQQYADGGQVNVVEGDQPLQQVDSGVSVSLDGGQTWLVLSGEGGVRAFIGRLQKNKEQGRELHRRGQVVKDLQATLYALQQQYDQAVARVDKFGSDIERYQGEVDLLQKQLTEITADRTRIDGEVKIVEDKLNELRGRIDEEQLLLDGCNVSRPVEPVSLWQQVRRVIARIINPLVVAYGR